MAHILTQILSAVDDYVALDLDATTITIGKIGLTIRKGDNAVLVESAFAKGSYTYTLHFLTVDADPRVQTYTLFTDVVTSLRDWYLSI